MNLWSPGSARTPAISSACALIGVSGGDREMKARGEEMVAEMLRCQKKAGDGYLAAFSVSTGKLLDKIYLNDQAKPGTGLSISSPVLVSNRIFVGSETGGLRAILATQEVP